MKKRKKSDYLDQKDVALSDRLRALIKDAENRAKFGHFFKKSKAVPQKGFSEKSAATVKKVDNKPKASKTVPKSKRPRQAALLLQKPPVKELESMQESPKDIAKLASLIDKISRKKKL